MSTVVGYEETVDTVTDLFLKELDERFAGKPNADGAIDIHTWLEYFTFDVMGVLSYGGRHGFLESGQDVNGIMSFVVRFVTYGFFVSKVRVLRWCTVEIDTYADGSISDRGLFPQTQPRSFVA